MHRLILRRRWSVQCVVFVRIVGLFAVLLTHASSCVSSMHYAGFVWPVHCALGICAVNSLLFHIAFYDELLLPRADSMNDDPFFCCSVGHLL